MRLLIAIPTLENISYRFVECLLALEKKLTRDGIDFEIKFHGGTLVYLARDTLTLEAINGKFTHVLWLDADMIFTDELLDDLMFSKKPFVSAIAHSRRPPHASCLFTSLKPPLRFQEYPANTFEVEACGFAGVLIETQILAEVQVKYHSCFFPMLRYGEDVAFCIRAKELGYKIYAEPGARMGHIGQKIVYPEDYKKYLDEIHR